MHIRKLSRRSARTHCVPGRLVGRRRSLRFGGCLTHWSASLGCISSALLVVDERCVEWPPPRMNPQAVNHACRGCGSFGPYPRQRAAGTIAA